MIYFDNAATTMDKPDEVIEAMTAALRTFGGAGRGVHGASIAASEAVYAAREGIARLLGAQAASRIAFTANATAALNMAIAGLLPARGRAVTTAASHNSVLRPLYRMRDECGCSLAVAPVRADGSLDYPAFERMLEDGADVVVATHASNVTGDVYDVARMARTAHEAGAAFVLDAAQTAGTLPIDMGEIGADVVCFTGHKALYGPQGTGGLAVGGDIELPPLMVGGSGFRSFEERHPDAMPESLEAGTANAHGLAGLAAGIAYLDRIGLETVSRRIEEATSRFLEGVRGLPNVSVLGGSTRVRSGIVAIVIDGMDSALGAGRLWSEFGICVRAGAHCAPLMHEALGTKESGAVRFSFSHRTSEAEIDKGIAALAFVAEGGSRV
ncbi:aminotransferase class V-fold PLP-dependent enzyme [Raoultibacter massiliensis]|uniref:aminotransferase class V-fold PLP-dependent enzyme n=1 Tax=Raoultibacter massiliensis TaxID=1852371 RepID=UPI003A92D267